MRTGTFHVSVSRSKARNAAYAALNSLQTPRSGGATLDNRVLGQHASSLVTAQERERVGHVVNGVSYAGRATEGKLPKVKLQTAAHRGADERHCGGCIQASYR
ncbi:MAG: phage major tail tube protein [Pelagimonas sp.]|jgi:hypothetical protein|nr:phage major tail tube protein [Pelagimonas sp.]